MDRSGIGSAQIHDLLENLRALGLDPDELTRAAGFDPSTLLTPGTRMSWNVFSALLETAERLARDPLVGLHAVEPGSRDLLTHLALAQPTVEEALRKFIAFLHVSVQEVRIDLERRPDIAAVVLAFGSAGPGEKPRPARARVERHVVEYIAGLIVVDLVEASRGRFRPSEVRFTHAPAGPVREYERVLRCPVRFHQRRSEIVITEPALRIRLGTHNPEVADLLADAAQHRLASAAPGTLRERVAAVLGAAVAHGRAATPTAIATALGMSARTLQRRLASEGESLRNLRDEARRELALERLRDPTVAISQLSSEMGFAEVAAFSKAFLRWTGETPRAYRQRHGSAQRHAAARSPQPAEGGQQPT